MTTAPARILATLTIIVLAACGGEPPADAGSTGEEASTPAAAAAEMAATVSILEPADGAEVAGAAVTVRLAAEGVTIVPAGDMTAGTGHHHLYLDADVAPPGQPVPTVPGEVIHLGTGVSEYVFENVPAGEHRLIAVVADGAHVPLQPWVVDTVTFTVR